MKKQECVKCKRKVWTLYGRNSRLNPASTYWCKSCRRKAGFQVDTPKTLKVFSRKVKAVAEPAKVEGKRKGGGKHGGKRHGGSDE
jgi:hypothetical protein